MNTATSALKPHHRELQDDPLLKYMAVGLIRGEFKDPTNAAKAALLVHGFNNDAHEESNVHRLIKKYKVGNWHAVGLEDVIQTEIRRRNKNGQPKPTNPTLYRQQAYSQLNKTIREYIEYEGMVDGVECHLGMAYLLEDFLWDWYGHVSSGRESVELLIESVPLAIHRFYEGMMVKQEGWRDKAGIVANYPHTTVVFAVDPGKPFEPQRLKTTRAGNLEAGSLHVAYKNPDTPDSRWLDTEIKRRQDHEHKHGYGYPLPVYRWPESKIEAPESKLRIINMHSDQAAGNPVTMSM